MKWTLFEQPPTRLFLANFLRRILFMRTSRPPSTHFISFRIFFPAVRNPRIVRLSRLVVIAKSNLASIVILSVSTTMGHSRPYRHRSCGFEQKLSVWECAKWSGRLLRQFRPEARSPPHLHSLLISEQKREKFSVFFQQLRICIKYSERLSESGWVFWNFRIGDGWNMFLRRAWFSIIFLCCFADYSFFAGS